MAAAGGRGPKPPTGGRLKTLLEQSIERLPAAYRPVVVLCDIEGLDPAEAAECLDLSCESASDLLRRGRALLRDELYGRATTVADSLFLLRRDRCDCIVRNFFTAVDLFHRPAE